MANEVGNSNLVTTWAFTGTKTEPDPSKFDQGWFLGERPPFEYMNWLQNDFGKKLNQLLTFGGAEWNTTTEYPPGAMVTDGGSSWQSLVTNTNSPPTLVNVNWAIVLTSAVASGALLAVNNLSDLNDAAIARSNLGLGGVAVLNNVPIANGGTGATSASGARSNLGLGNVATENIVPITKGGTGSTTASTARTALGLGSAAVKDLTDNNDLSVNPSDVGTRGNMAAAIATNPAIGVGQTWQDVLSQRAHSTSYQNTTGGPIMVSIRGGSTSVVRTVEISVDNLTFVNVGSLGAILSGGNDDEGVQVIVPDTHYYRVNGSLTLSTWAELR